MRAEHSVASSEEVTDKIIFFKENIRMVTDLVKKKKKVKKFEIIF